MFADDININGGYNGENQAQVHMALSESLRRMVDWATYYEIPSNLEKSVIFQIGKHSSGECAIDGTVIRVPYSLSGRFVYPLILITVAFFASLVVLKLAPPPDLLPLFWLSDFVLRLAILWTRSPTSIQGIGVKNCTLRSACSLLTSQPRLLVAGVVSYSPSHQHRCIVTRIFHLYLVIALNLSKAATSVQSIIADQNEYTVTLVLTSGFHPL